MPPLADAVTAGLAELREPAATAVNAAVPRSARKTRTCMSSSCLTRVNEPLSGLDHRALRRRRLERAERVLELAEDGAFAAPARRPGFGSRTRRPPASCCPPRPRPGRPGGRARWADAWCPNRASGRA